MYRVAQHPIDIKDENEAKYTSILNPGIKISNSGRKFQDERSNTEQILMTGHGRLVNKAI